MISSLSRLPLVWKALGCLGTQTVFTHHRDWHLCASLFARLLAWQDEALVYGDRLLLVSAATNATLSTSPHQSIHGTLPPTAIPLSMVFLSLSGIFISTFTLVFAYISASVQDKQVRVSAYALAMATFAISPCGSMISCATRRNSSGRKSRTKAANTGCSSGIEARDYA